jgi:transcriptional regulator with XRE-family HTH domain
MLDLDDLERAAGLDPDSADYRLREQLAAADDDLLERLVQMRKDKGLTQQAVADRMHRDKAAVSNFERLNVDPHLSTIRRYAAAIGAAYTHEVREFDLDSVSSADYEPHTNEFQKLTEYVTAHISTSTKMFSASDFLLPWHKSDMDIASPSNTVDLAHERRIRRSRRRPTQRRADLVRSNG